ncbi:MltA domain-containing protein [Candidatus Hepatincolaceae symbiont of Richtersius coronifer]
MNIQSRLVFLSFFMVIALMLVRTWWLKDTTNKIAKEQANTIIDKANLTPFAYDFLNNVLSKNADSSQSQPNQSLTDYKLHRKNFSEIKGWENEKNFKEFTGVLLDNLAVFISPKLLTNTVVTLNPFTTIADWQKMYYKIKELDYLSLDEITLRHFFEHNFIPYLIDQENSGRATGYVTYVLSASKTKDKIFKYPIYKKPPPEKLFHTTEEIVNGALEGLGLELYYAKHQVEVFLLKTNGSGIINLPDGSKEYVVYAGNNGYPYFPLGKYLLEQGYIKANEASVKGITDFFKNNLDKAHLLNKNQRVIYFAIQEKGHIYGAFGGPVLKERTIAVDKSYLSLGLPLFLKTQYNDSNKAFEKLVVANDVGSAIKGLNRIDIYFGEDLSYANTMKEPITLYILLPKT